MMDEFLRRLRYYFRRREFEAELDEEMQHHRSLSGAKQFGNVAQLKEDSRAMWTWTVFEQLAQDLRYASRSAFANKTFMGLAVLSLALGIGANTAIYSFVESILLRSLPVPDPESLVTLNWTTRPGSPAGDGAGDPLLVRSVYSNTLAYLDPRRGRVANYFPYAAFEMFRQESAPFRSVFAYSFATGLNVLADGRSEVLGGSYVSGEYFASLGVVPAAGRLVTPDDDRIGAPVVAVLSHNLWMQRFGGAADAIGRTISINKTPVTIIGVVPPEFFGVDAEGNPDLYLPLRSNLTILAGTPLAGMQGWYTDAHFYWVQMMARLKPGVNMEQAEAALAPRFHGLVESTANAQERAVLPALLLKEGAAGLDSLRREYSRPLYLLMTLVGLILAIACANIANLLLARGAARRRELAVRLSVGASRGRVIRQLLTESVLLASLGGAAGAAVGLAGMRFLTFLLANGREGFTLRAALNWNVLAATAGLSLLAGVLFGLAPALASTRVDVMPTLRAARSETRGPRRGWVRGNLSQVLLAGQIALSFLLLMAAGLFVRSLSNLQSTDVGFNQENLLLVGINPQPAGIPGPELTRFHMDLRGRMARIPGVRQATFSNLALLGGSSMNMRVTVPGARETRTSGLYVGPAFFETLQIPLIRGRGVEERDGAGAPAVAVVNELFARTHFGGEDAIGRTFTIAPAATPVEIVGVVGNTRYANVKQDLEPLAYLSAAQAFRPQIQATYELRSVGDPLALVNTVRELIRQVDERIVVTQAGTQSARIDRTLNREIVFAGLCTGFAMLALLIAAVGLYASTAVNVARRTNEIGIRMALGAQRGGVIWMVLRDVAVLCAIGLAIGIPVALAASRLVESFLYGMNPEDPLALAGAVVVLIAAALAAAIAPARRAARIDPMAALRHE
jgi:predicted permease